ncbi:putative membrane protein [Lewinella aquimaris]|uniref:Putative membrane protein n=1 Tax=Neolewinella aquimaris TaxID=1835722 RepID=A0A840EAD2_9BACT|nr:DUF1304 domain-containing protein [Neolewinella aquimaris]MBB4080367.1 putative membrane protein [Neolewinella aquimaris]
MILAGKILVGFIAVLHLYIAWLEMFAWETRGPKVFRGVPKKLFPETKVLAANQGLYNAFLAAGLIWSLLIRNEDWGQHVALFFLGCIAVAGVFGAFTAERKILFVQTIPATVALLLLLLG